MTMIQLLELGIQYPIVLIFVGWPVAFLWLLHRTNKQSERREEAQAKQAAVREERLIQANEKWADALGQMVSEMKYCTVKTERR